MATSATDLDVGEHVAATARFRDAVLTTADRCQSRMSWSRQPRRGRSIPKVFDFAQFRMGINGIALHHRQRPGQASVAERQVALSAHPWFDRASMLGTVFCLGSRPGLLIVPE
jgi:hypothetical protein